MTPDMQNPAVQGRVSRDCFGGPSHHFFIASDCRAQMLATRFHLSPWMARDMARLCFGEGRND